MSRRTWKFLAILHGVLIGFLAIEFILFPKGALLTFAPSYVSPDKLHLHPLNQVTFPTPYWAGKVICCSILMTLFSIYVMYNRPYPPKVLKKIFWNPIVGMVSVIAFIYFLQTLSGWEHLAVLYEEDRLFESMTALFLLLSSAILMAALLFARKGVLVYAKIWILILAGFTFFVGMEEISWGQRLFGWDTPGFWKSANYQEETNFHNIRTPVVSVFVYIFLFSCSLIFGLGSLLKKYLVRWKCDFVVPDQKFLLFSFFSLFFWWVNEELFEEVLSVLFLFYSLDILRYLKKDAQNVKAPEQMT